MNLRFTPRKEWGSEKNAKGVEIVGVKLEQKEKEWLIGN